MKNIFAFMKRSLLFLPASGELRILLFVIGLLVGVALVGGSASLTNNTDNTAAVASPFIYYFNSIGTLNETGAMLESTSPYWWLNSGGQLLIKDGVGSSIHGSAPVTNLWRTLYAVSNPVDTDQGTHPQNLFRLVTKSKWQNFSQEAQFYIDQNNLSDSPNRNASNGLLLMNRYADSGQTLYYAGIRVDGTAVIKKKYKGTYYTMAQKAVLPGTYSGSKDEKNLLPHNEWVGLKTETNTNSDGSVRVSLYMKRENETSWTRLLEATDKGQYGATPPITASGYAGIRTDFMDVRFDMYKLTKI